MAFWGLDPIKQRGALRKIKAKADSVKPIANYEHGNIRTEKREYEIGQWPLDSLCNEIYLQLDSKWIKDEKNGLRKRKYRESAKSYAYRLPMDARLATFYIDSSDLSRRVNQELESIDYELADYVMKEAIGRIFDSIGEPYLKLSVRHHVDWEIYPD